MKELKQKFNKKMKTLTGFFNTKKLATHEKQVAFVKDAMLLSYDVHIETKYVDTPSRHLEDRLSIQEVLDMANDLKCVDRSIQFHIVQSGEVSFVLTSAELPWTDKKEGYTKGWVLLYCHMNLKNLKQLTKQYKLKME